MVHRDVNSPASSSTNGTNLKQPRARFSSPLSPSFRFLSNIPTTFDLHLPYAAQRAHSETGNGRDRTDITKYVATCHVVGKAEHRYKPPCDIYAHTQIEKTYTHTQQTQNISKY